MRDSGSRLSVSIQTFDLDAPFYERKSCKINVLFGFSSLLQEEVNTYDY